MSGHFHTTGLMANGRFPVARTAGICFILLHDNPEIMSEILRIIIAIAATTIVVVGLLYTARGGKPASASKGQSVRDSCSSKFRRRNLQQVLPTRPVRSIILSEDPTAHLFPILPGTTHHHDRNVTPYTFYQRSAGKGCGFCPDETVS